MSKKEIILYEVTEFESGIYIMCDLNYEEQKDFEKLKKANFYLNEGARIEDLKTLYVDAFITNDKYFRLEGDQLHEERRHPEADFRVELFESVYGEPMTFLIGLDFNEDLMSGGN